MKLINAGAGEGGLNNKITLMMVNKERKWLHNNHREEYLIKLR